MGNLIDSKIIIVPWDFTHVSEYALEYSLMIAKSLEKEVILLHVVSQEATEESLLEAKKRLDKRTSDVQAEHAVKTSGVIRTGSIFSVISDFASEVDASMVIMGTHGIKGTQKLTGSFALKVIIGSKVPFVVVQEKPTSPERFSRIIYPIDFRGESKELLQWAIYLGKYFNSRIQIYRRPFRDSSLLKKTNTNVNFAIRFLRQNNLEYEIVEAPGKINFDKETIQYATEIKADLILMVTSRHFTFLDFLLGNREQRIIANPAGISVMCINPHATKSGVGQFMYGST